MEVVRKRLTERRLLDPSATYQALASSIRVPKSYVSKVMNADADLSSDQMYRVCAYFHLSDDESEYMQLLLAYARTGIQARKAALKRQILTRQRPFLETAAHIPATAIEAVSQNADSNRYYLQPLFQLVHVCLSIPRYQKDQHALASDLSVNPVRVLEAMDYLESMRIIERKDGLVKVLVDSLHLSKEADVYQAWRSQMKLRAIARQEEIADDDEAYNYTVVFAAGKDAARAIRCLFLGFLKHAQEAATGSEATRAYQMSFEIFPLT